MGAAVLLACGVVLLVSFEPNPWKRPPPVAVPGVVAPLLAPPNKLLVGVCWLAAPPAGACAPPNKLLPPALGAAVCCLLPKRLLPPDAGAFPPNRPPEAGAAPFGVEDGGVLAAAPPNSEPPAAGACACAGLGSSFFCPKLNPPLSGVVLPLCVGAAPPKRPPPAFCSPPPAAGAFAPNKPPLEGCGVVEGPPNKLFCSPPLEAAGFAPNNPPPLEGWGVVVPLPLPNALACWPPLAAAPPKRLPPVAGVVLAPPKSPPPEVGVAAPPKSGLLCCWVLLAPAVPKSEPPAAPLEPGVLDPKLKDMLALLCYALCCVCGRVAGCEQ